MTTSEQAARSAVYNAAFIHNIDHKGKHLAERCPQFTAALDELTAAIEQRVRRERDAAISDACWLEQLITRHHMAAHSPKNIYDCAAMLCREYREWKEQSDAESG